MAELLPWFFIAAAVLAMLGGLVSLWLSLTGSLSEGATQGVRASLTSEARLALLTEKDALLQEIRDVAFEDGVVSEVHHLGRAATDLARDEVPPSPIAAGAGRQSGRASRGIGGGDTRFECANRWMCGIDPVRGLE